MDLLSGAEAAFLAFLAGLAPVCIWLVFWLREDAKRPEPKRYIFLAFIAGMGAVLLVLPLQALAAAYIPMGFVLLFLWALTEEGMKFAVAWFSVLRRSVADEPIDMPIYMITAALGFSALENAFFLFHPLATGQFFDGLVTGDLRFLGASLMHVLASSLVGGALAFSYYRSRWAKIFHVSFGVILAAALHGLFNSLIISTDADGALIVFLGVWMGTVFLLLMLERVKTIERPQWWEKAFMSNEVQ